MCNLGKMIARENIEKRISTRTKKKNIELITNLMNSLSISFSKAVELLKVSEDEVLEIEKYFKSYKNGIKLNTLCYFYDAFFL